MVSSSLKDIVAHIRKEAVKPPQPASMVPAKRLVPDTGKRKDDPRNVVHDPSIKKMQITIQKLAQAVSATINYDALNKSMQAPTETKGEYGKDLFSNFMVNRYLRTSDVKGVEFDPKVSQESGSDLKYISTVLGNLNLIGQATRFADGAWEHKTNNALKNAYAIADSLMRLGQDLGMQSKAFDANKVAELGKLIPEKAEDLSIAEKEERAPIITEILEGVIALLADFKQQVLQHPTYQALIKGEPLLTLSPKKSPIDSLGGEQAIHEGASRFGGFSVTLPKEYVPQQYATVDIKPFAITATDLLSPQTFEQWIGKSSILSNLKRQNPQSFVNVIKSLLDQIKQQVKQKLVPSIGPGY